MSSQPNLHKFVQLPTNLYGYRALVCSVYLFCLLDILTWLRKIVLCCPS